MSDTFENRDSDRDPNRDRETNAKAERIVAGVQQPRATTSRLTSLEFDDETLRTKEKLAGIVAALMILGPLFFGWSGIGRM